MKHILIFIALVTLGITVSCGGDLAGVKMKDSLRNGKGNEDVSRKPAPPYGSMDRTTLLFNETNRLQRTLRNLVAAPESSPSDSCVKYVSTPKEKGIFLVARYANCHWTQELSGERGGFIFAYQGREEYANTGDKAQARASLRVVVARSSQPRVAISNSTVEHIVTLSGADKMKSVAAESTMGTIADVTKDYWKMTVVDGEWQLRESRSLTMKAGTSLTWLYRPASGSKAKAAPAFKVILTANEDISFGTACPWPIAGSFELREVDQSGDDSISEIEVSAKGYRGKDHVLHAWPTDHCLGLK